jgi:DNA modification methylase
MNEYRLICGNSLDVLKTLSNQSIQCCVTSPPYYGLRDYGVNGQIGLEQTPDEYVQKLVDVFREVKRVLRDDGTLWLNLGDSYAGKCSRASNGGRAGFGTPREGVFDRGASGLKDKDLCGIPWRVAFALQVDGWWLRSDIIWSKTNPMPESVKDRPTRSHEYIFLLTKSKKYYYDYQAVLEPATGYDGRKDTIFKGSTKNYDGVMPNGKPQSFAQNGHERWQYKNLQEDGQKPNTMHVNRLIGNEYMSPVRNKRDVWVVSTKPFRDAHFATFPEDLIVPCVLAGCPQDGVILDPFNGAGTTGVVCKKNGRNYIGIDLNPEYIEMSKKRIKDTQQQMRLPL